jgi:predicted CXXCH cytochrome family protein
MHIGKKDFMIMLLLLLLVFLIGCSPKVVSFFFDGVPAPDSTSMASRDSLQADSSGITLIASQTARPQLTVHPPYKLKKCTICHNTSAAAKMSQPEPGLCYLCHDDYSLNYKFVHGPAAAGYCTNCHHPHASENSKLLRRTGQQLCLECHDAKDIFKKPSHAAIGQAACTDCHNPHGGNDKNLLR